MKQALLRLEQAFPTTSYRFGVWFPLFLSLVFLMQNTRLNNLVNLVLTQLSQWLTNPWRYFSVILISLLVGVFLGSAIPTTAGQSADWDILAAGVLLLFTEGISWWVYRRQQPTQSQTSIRWRDFLVRVINALKIGLTYSMFVEAFKIGS